MLQHILVPTEGSKLSVKAERVALGLAAALGARVIALRVLPATVYDFVGDVVAARKLAAGEARASEQIVAKTPFRKVENAVGAASLGYADKCVTSDDAYRSIITTARNILWDHRDGIAWAVRPRRPASRQRNAQGVDACHDPGARAPLAPWPQR